MDEPILLGLDDLREFVHRAFVAAGVPCDKAAKTADVVAWTNLRGIDSHGVQLLPHYVEQLKNRFIEPAEEGRIVSQSGACMVYDAALGLGQITARICCEHAVRLANEHGVGMVISRNSNHFGPAGFWSWAMSNAGYIGVSMCDASMQVPPWQGREQRFGTNPMSVAVPHPAARGWLLDMATTTVALGKLEQAWLKGLEEIPHGWALDADGVPTTRTVEAKMLSPLGGYKGSGLAMMVEILAGVLGGGEYFGSKVSGIRDKTRPIYQNHAFIAIHADRFLPLEQLEKRMERLSREVKSSAPARGYDEVLIAGDPEWRIADERRRNGVPIHPGVWRTVVEMADRLAVTVPQPRPTPYPPALLP